MKCVLHCLLNPDTNFKSLFSFYFKTRFKLNIICSQSSSQCTHHSSHSHQFLCKHVSCIKPHILDKNTCRIFHSRHTHQELRTTLRVSVQLLVQGNQVQVDVVQLGLQALVLMVVALKLSFVAQTRLFIHNGRKHTLDGKKKKGKVIK